MNGALADLFEGIENAAAMPERPEPYRKAFIEGRPVSAVFNGIYTVTNRRTKSHRTYRIRTQPKDSNFAPGQRVVALLTGSDNTSDYTGFAFLSNNGQGLHIWRAKLDTKYEGHAKVVQLALIDKSPRFLAMYEVLEEARCIRCNRKLTTPESVKSGIGPICAGRE